MAALLFALLLVVSAAGARADDLRPFDAASWQAIRKAHAGRPTLVHFWGMTCGPCRVEMPKLGALIAKHPELDVVTVDTDDLPGTAAAATAFLTQSAMPLRDAWQFADPFAEKLYFAVDPSWQGEIPLTLLLASDGTTTTRLGAVAPDDIESWLAAQRRASGGDHKP